MKPQRANHRPKQDRRKESRAAATPLIVSLFVHSGVIAALTLWPGFDPTPEPAVDNSAPVTVRLARVTEPQPVEEPVDEQPPDPSRDHTAPAPPRTVTPRPTPPRVRAADEPADRDATPNLPTTVTPPPPPPPERQRPRLTRPLPEREIAVESPEPKLLSRLQPKYPRECRRRGHEGVVVVELQVAADGSVTSARVIEPASCRHMNEAALETAKGLRYLPAIRGGESVASKTTLRLRYQLAG